MPPSPSNHLKVPILLLSTGGMATVSAALVVGAYTVAAGVFIVTVTILLVLLEVAASMYHHESDRQPLRRGPPPAPFQQMVHQTQMPFSHAGRELQCRQYAHSNDAMRTKTTAILFVQTTDSSRTVCDQSGTRTATTRTERARYHAESVLLIENLSQAGRSLDVQA